MTMNQRPFTDKIKMTPLEISEYKLVEGGLYMPMFVRKDHFFQVNQFPEGNLKNDNNLYDTNYALKGEVSIPGDRIFIKRLSEIGIKHQTPLDSNIYHFQNGEMDDKNLDTKKVKRGYYESELKIITSTPKELPEYAIVKTFTKLLERQIKNKPEYYFWTHKRWKHRDKKPSKI